MVGGEDTLERAHRGITIVPLGTFPLRLVEQNVSLAYSQTEMENRTLLPPCSVAALPRVSASNHDSGSATRAF